MIVDSYDYLYSQLDIIQQGRVFSGGKRHHEIVASLLPADAQWIDITTPLDAVFEKYQSIVSDIIVFASGDPLFFGFANTIRKKMPEAEITLYPTFLPAAVGASTGDALPRHAHRLADWSPLA